MSSTYYFNSDIEIPSTIDLSHTQSTPIPNSKFTNSVYNNPHYKLEPSKESQVYIIKYSLFKRTLLPIISNQPQKLLVEYTL